jgi:hypothetical protein
VGGLGLAILTCLLIWARPTAWWLLLASALAGSALGVVMIVAIVARGSPGCGTEARAHRMVGGNNPGKPGLN